MSDRPAFVHRLTVRFRDCDLMGHVNNSVYFTYLEQARLDWWRHLGGMLNSSDATMIVARAECDYRAPAFLDDALEVRVTPGPIGRSSFVIEYEIVNAASGQRIAQARTVSVSVDPETHRPVPVPDAWRAMITGSTA